MGPNQFLDFARGASNCKLKLRGSIGAETKHDVDVTLVPGGSEIRFCKPVVENDDGYTVIGTPEEVRGHVERIAKRKGIPEDQVDQLLESATTFDIGDGMATATVTLNLDDATRLACKATLGAIALVAGDRAVLSALGEELRRLLRSDRPSDELRTVDPAAINVAVDAINSALPGVRSVDPIPSPGRDGRVVLVSLSGATAVFVSLAGTLIPPMGILVNAPPPLGGGMPVVIEDRIGGLAVRSLESELAEAIRRAAATHDGRGSDQ